MAELKTPPELPGQDDTQKPDGPHLVRAHHEKDLDRTAAAPGAAVAVAATELVDPKSGRSSRKTRSIAKSTYSGETLQDSEARYRRLFEAAQDGILILNAETGLITDVNPFLVNLLGYSHEEFLGKELWEIGLFQDIEASKAAFRELLTKHYIRYKDLPLETKSGRAINVEFVSNVYGVNGKKVIQCNIRDITKRIYAERSEQQLRQAQKMEAVGQLAGGVAHDFNNLLGVILGYCEILEEQLDLPEATRRKMIVEIHNAGASARDLTQHLLAFSRRQVSQPMFLDLNGIVDRVHVMLNRLIGDDIELVSVLSPNLGSIKADPSQVEQVLMNLAVNARDAMPQGGKITVGTANVEIDEIYVRQHPYSKPGSYVVLTVSDTGIGMDEDTQSRIFEPFFSTKEVGKGTGLGLSTVFGIVKQSAGTINVYSEPGQGTTFKIHFPRCQEAPLIIQPETEAPLRGGSETILLVDDAAPLRGLTRLLLEGCGYTVLDTGEPVAAISMAAQHKGPLPLMITDVVMPGLSGPVLAEKLGAARPEMRVLYTSGYADDEVARHGMIGSECAFLEKPFTRDALVRKVRELLDLPILPSL
jgi:two-component system, cell cycle sensor histidine kinase and response regulator CckA